MKRMTKSIIAMVFFALIANATLAQDTKAQNFKHVDLMKLKKAFVNQLLSDGLIEKRKDDIFLTLQTEKTLLNDKPLSSELHQNYSLLLASYEIDQGSNRVIYITRECIAVGDFKDGSFNGRVQGKLDLDEHPFSTR